MKEHPERSDPVDVLALIDAAHVQCWCAVRRAREQRLRESLRLINGALHDVQEVARIQTEHLAAWEQAHREQRERRERRLTPVRPLPLARVVEQSNLYRDSLAAGLQHQRINPTFR